MMARERSSTRRSGKLQPAANERDVDTAIVGAGIAGLYCALHLSQKGIGFRVFEQSQHIGGRIVSLRIARDGTRMPDDAELKGNVATGFRWMEGTEEKELEFCAEFGPMRIELKQQELLSNLIHGLRLTEDLEPFPPYASATNEHDPKYELVGEEAEQTTPLDLLELAIVRILGRLKVASLSKHSSTWERHHRPRLEQSLEHLIKNLARAAATRQLIWKHILHEWLESLSESDYQTIRVFGVFDDSTPDGTPLWDMGFWNLLSEVLSHHAVLKIRDLGTFYHLIPENPNAAEWLIFWLRGLKTSEQLVGIAGGLQRITYAMRQRIRDNIGEEPILTGMTLMNLQSAGERATLTFENSKSKTSETWTARRVILAVPALPLRNLALLSKAAVYDDFQLDLASSFGFPLLKLFLVLKERWWDEDAARTNRYATMVPTRELHYRKSSIPGSKKGMLLFYTDRPAVTFWSNYIVHKERSRGRTPLGATSGFQATPDVGTPDENPRLVQRILNYMREYGVRRRKDGIEVYAIRDWGREPFGGASHAWLPERRSWIVMRRLAGFALGSGPYRASDPTSTSATVHICGEAYSDYQGFIEGALRSAAHVLHVMNPKLFQETKTPWLCDDKVCKHE